MRLKSYYKAGIGRGPRCHPEQPYGGKDLCVNCWARQYRTTPKAQKAQRRRQLRRMYGLTEEDYQRKFEQQMGKCAICYNVPDTRYLYVDHNKSTGQIRGLLCRVCNANRVGANTAETAQRVLNYLVFFESDVLGVTDDSGPPRSRTTTVEADVP